MTGTKTKVVRGAGGNSYLPNKMIFVLHICISVFCEKGEWEGPASTVAVRSN